MKVAIEYFNVKVVFDGFLTVDFRILKTLLKLELIKISSNRLVPTGIIFVIDEFFYLFETLNALKACLSTHKF